MSATVVARGLAGGHGARTLYADLDLVVAPGDVVGLVGANGAGKSTLLRALAGLDEPLEGTVEVSPPGASVGWLPQEVERRAGEDVAGFLRRRTGVGAADAELEAAATALGEGAAGSDDRYAEAFERWMALGAADLDDRTGPVLADLGLDVELDRATSALSGGQAARLGLAALLLSRYDVLLLDEPTNDLDLDGLARLERFVHDQRSGVVVVSHDREFLARCVTTVVELDLAQQRVDVYGGGYEAYLEERAVARAHARAEFEEYAGTRDQLSARARTQRSWLDKGVRNAINKASDPDKILRNKQRESTEKQAAKARQTERRIERLEVVEEPRKEWQLQYSIAAAPRGSSVVATASGAVVRRGSFELGPISAQIGAGDRIGVTGPNGAGKTTLLRLLLGRLAPGELVAGSASLGASTAVGEVDQARAALGGAPGAAGTTAGGAPAGPAGTAPSLVDVLGLALPDWPTGEVRTLLAKFGLTGHHVERPTAGLSPGERTRAALALLQARGVNLLVLDEPTNHLDLAAIEQLEQALEAYTGTLLLVTHDRRMLAAVRTTRRWSVEDGRLHEA